MEYELDDLFLKFTEAGVNFRDFKKEDLNIVVDVVREKSTIIWINNGVSDGCYFINRSGMNFFYGIENNYFSSVGRAFYKNIIHPDYADDLSKWVEAGKSSTSSNFNGTIQARNKAKEWRWIYSVSKTLNYKPNGDPEFVLCAAHCIEDLIYEYNYGGKEQQRLAYREKYEFLTSREHQVLRMIALEMKSNEIAEGLSIKPTTVDTHRKNMIRKLEVRSTVGLLRYYYLMESDTQSHDRQLPARWTHQVSPILYERHWESDIDNLIMDLKEQGVSVARMTSSDVKLLKRICDNKNEIIWLGDHSKIQAKFINNAGARYFGLPSGNVEGLGIEFYQKCLHRSSHFRIHKSLLFFQQNPGKIFRMTYFARNAEKGFRWVYSESRPITFDKKGNAVLILRVIRDVEDLLQLHFNSMQSCDFENGYLLYSSLTSREREIMNMVVAEIKSKEIGERLNIAASTVDSHRKNIIRKLGLKSSAGMVRFSMAYSNGGFIRKSTQI